MYNYFYTHTYSSIFAYNQRNLIINIKYLSYFLKNEREFITVIKKNYLIVSYFT